MHTGSTGSIVHFGDVGHLIGGELQSIVKAARLSIPPHLSAVDTRYAFILRVCRMVKRYRLFL